MPKLPIQIFEEAMEKKRVHEETTRIMSAIDEYVWYNVPVDLKIEAAKAKSGEVMFAVMQVLVDKGLITYDDFIKTLGKN